MSTQWYAKKFIHITYSYKTHTHAHAHNHIYIYIFIHVCVYIYIYICMYIHTHIYKYICVYIYIYKYIYKTKLATSAVSLRKLPSRVLRVGTWADYFSAAATAAVTFFAPSSRSWDARYTACCSVLQRVAVCCSVLQCVAVRLLGWLVECNHTSLHVYTVRLCNKNSLSLSLSLSLTWLLLGSIDSRNDFHGSKVQHIMTTSWQQRQPQCLPLLCHLHGGVSPECNSTSQYMCFHTLQRTATHCNTLQHTATTLHHNSVTCHTNR